MQVTLNGEQREIPAGATIVALLSSLGLDRGRVAVELNEQVIPKARHETTAINEGDRIEIVTFVGGG